MQQSLMTMMYTTQKDIYSNLMVGDKNYKIHAHGNAATSLPSGWLSLIILWMVIFYLYFGELPPNFVFEHDNSFYVLICRTIIHNRVITANWNKIKYISCLGNIESKNWEILVNWFDFAAMFGWRCFKKFFFASYLRN